MRKIKKLLKKLDIFGIPMTFRYKTKDKYSSSLGGFTLILFCVLASTLGIYYLIKFINRENFKIIYYTINISKTDSLKLKDSNSTFTVGFDCESKGRFKVDDVLKIEIQYINYTKSTDGKYNKNKTLLSDHFCNHKDFYNAHNDSFDRLNLQKFKCLDDYGGSLAGIYSNPIFTYYEFSVVSKYDTPENLDNIEEYLLQNDCKLKIAYIDITMDLNNHKNPINYYLTDVFIQLDPTLFIKRNIFFMNQYLMDDDTLFGIFKEENYSFITTLYSRYEEYALYLGLNRCKVKPPNYLNYAKLYLRADTKKTDIRRTYQNIMEFYADVSSLLLGILRLLIIIINFFNNFYAEYSFSKRIFIFKEFENSHFDISKRYKQINQLKSLIEANNLKDTDDNSYEKDLSAFYSNNKIFENFESNTYNKISKTNININTKNDNKSNYHPNQGKINLIFNEKNYKSNKRNTYLSYKQNRENLTFKNDNNSTKTDKVFPINNDRQSGKNIMKNDIIHKDSKRTKITYYFNIFEICIISFCKCSLTRGLKIKKNFHDIIGNILNQKLDVIFYIKNMLICDIINETLFNSKNIEILNFLSRPVISINKNNEKQLPKFEHNFGENEYDKLHDGISELIQKEEKTQMEENLILLSEKKLSELI